jgi:ATP-dependent helicase Lhr and Lhr-like helicase
MSRLDPDAIRNVINEIWPRVRSADELYEAFMVSGFITVQEILEKNELELWNPFFNELIAGNRATLLITPDNHLHYWVAVERLPEFQQVMPSAIVNFLIPIPENIQNSFAKINDPLVEILRSRLDISGPVTANNLSEMLLLPLSEIERGLAVLENEGFVFRGHFLSSTEEEWCERRLLARIHRYTIDKLRNAIQPVSSSDFMHFLFQWHHMLPGQEQEGAAALQSVLGQLEGYEAQSVAWEGDIFPVRIKNYSYTLLDLLLMTGEYVWGDIN